VLAAAGSKGVVKFFKWQTSFEYPNILFELGHEEYFNDFEEDSAEYGSVNNLEIMQEMLYIIKLNDHMLACCGGDNTIKIW